MGSQDLADRVAATHRRRREPGAVEAVILERHGAVAVGPDPGVAVDRLELIEVLCRTWLDALLRPGGARALDGAAIVDVPDNRSATRTVEG